MASCGVSVNLSSIESSISAHIGNISGLAGMAGLPNITSGLLASVALSNGNYLAALQIVVPSSVLEEAWGSIRGEFGKLVDSALEGGISDLGNLTEIQANIEGITKNAVSGSYSYLEDEASASSFGKNLVNLGNTWGGNLKTFADSTGLSSLSGYVDIDITDLAKSAIGFGASFDECDFGVSGIANYMRDPATGTVKLLGNYAPKLGDTSLPGAAGRYGFSSTEYSTFAASAKATVLGKNSSLSSIVSTFVPDEITNLIPISQGNISSVTSLLDKNYKPSKTDGVRRLTTGETVVENQAAGIDLLKEKNKGTMPAIENSLSTAV